jgi:alpha-glucosidase
VLALRKEHPALLTGDIRVLEAGEAMLAFERFGDEEAVLCVFNLSPEPQGWSPAQPDRWRPVIETGVQNWQFEGYGTLITTKLG